MQNNAKLDAVDVSAYDAIFVSGGLAPMVDMPEHPLLKKIIAETYERGAIVGAVCHGPVSLLNVKLSDGSLLVKNKNITAFTTEEEHNYASADVPFDLQTALTEQGANFHAGTAWAPNSIIDGNLVTGQNPASAGVTARNVISLLEG
jgi:putative intracellular protease/amidase